MINSSYTYESPAHIRLPFEVILFRTTLPGQGLKLTFISQHLRNINTLSILFTFLDRMFSSSLFFSPSKNVICFLPLNILLHIIVIYSIINMCFVVYITHLLFLFYNVLSSRIIELCS